MKDLYDFLVTNNVSPNGLFVMHCIKHNYAYAKSNVATAVEQQKLENHKYIVVQTPGLNSVYKLTPKGENLLIEAENILTKMKRVKKSVHLAEWEDNIKEYNDLFPMGKKEGSTLTFRTNPRELMERFIWFFKEYPEYTWDMVMQATRNYVKNFDESTGYTFMQTSKYFIKKEDRSKTINSTLADMCYNMSIGNDAEVESGYHYFGP